MGFGGEEIHRDKTIQWAQEVGISEENARIIGDANIGVDNNYALFGGTGPVPIFGDQSYHFNTNGNDSSKIDSRLEHAREHMKRALEYKAKGDLESAYEELGKGLHAFQDIYAHTDDLVTYNALKDLYHHVDHMEADDPNYKPNRIRNTEFATKQYLKYISTH